MVINKALCGSHGVLCVFKCTEANQRFRILRFFSDERPPKRIKIVNTLELAKMHCSSPGTSGVLKNGVKWFYGYTEIKKGDI